MRRSGAWPTRTDAAGRYALTGIAAGEYSLLFRLAGYAELHADRLQVDESVTLRHDATLETSDLGVYLGRYLSAAQARQLAQLIGGTPANRQSPGIPLGTVALDHATVDYHITMTYENFGNIDRWGADLALEASLGRGISVAGRVLDLQREGTAPGLGDAPDTPFRVPRSSGSGRRSLQRSQPPDKRRAARAFRRGLHGVRHTLLASGRRYSADRCDRGLATAVPYAPRLTISAQNLLDRRRPQELGAPAIGRLVPARLVYDF